VLIIMTMRADFLHRAAEYRDLARAIGDHDIIVSPLASDELRRAITGPAEAVGCDFEPGLVDELVEQVQAQPGALPLLEYALLELWKARAPGGVLTWRAYEEIGKVEGALAARADSILAASYTPEQQEQLRRALLRLVQPGEGAADTRRRTLLADLVPAGGSVAEVQALLQPLVDARLLVVTTNDQRSTINDEGPTVDQKTDKETRRQGDMIDSDLLVSPSPGLLVSQSSVVEVAHEALIRAWPTLGKWIGEARADIQFQIRLEEAAKEWERSGDNPDFLWSGLRLANVEAWQARARPQLNARELRFLEASRAARRRTGRVRLITWSAIGVLIIAILAIITGGALFFAQQQQQNADKERDLRSTAEVARDEAQQQTRLADQRAHQARAGELATQSQATGEQFPQRSLLLAVDALHVTAAANEPPIAAAEQSLRDQLARTGGRALRGHTNWVGAVAFSPDGRWALTGSDDTTARLWDTQAADPSASARILRGHTSWVTAAAFSPDGRWALTGSADGTARLWDTQIADPSASARMLRGHTSAVNAVAFSPDGRWVLTGDDTTVRIWPVRIDDLLALACRTAGRNLTWEEWQQYFPGQNYRATCPDLPPHFSFIAHLVQQGDDLAQQGKITAALAAYKDVQQRYPTFEIHASWWDILCRYGTLWGQASTVLDACEQAVKLEPDVVAYRDSRGLARALTGNIAGAIEDFNAFITWALNQDGYAEKIVERKVWVAALQAGRNPFDAATLERLRGE
jgi:tetratricopeptide (TPR) repeat protein